MESCEEFRVGTIVRKPTQCYSLPPGSGCVLNTETGFVRRENCKTQSATSESLKVEREYVKRQFRARHEVTYNLCGHCRQGQPQVLVTERII